MKKKKINTTKLDSILYIELATVGTYERVLSKTSNPFGASDLKRIMEEHLDAVRLVGDRVRALGGNTNPELNLQDNLTVIAEGSGAPFEDPFALKALSEREEQNILSFENALGDSLLEEEDRELILTCLLPRAQQHLTALNRMLVAA